MMVSTSSSSSSSSIRHNPALLLDVNTSSSSVVGASMAQVVTIHPMVLMSILDHHMRRQEINGRVIGTLLGRRNGHMVEVTNCFAVPHAERGDEVAIGKDFNKTMVQLHRKTNRKEVVVGWYATTITGDDSTTPSTSPSTSSTSSFLVADNSSLIHDFYATEADDGEPIHMVVDTRLLLDAIPIRGYISTPILIQNEPMANLFHEIQVQVQSSDAEAICLHEMKRQFEESESSSGSGRGSTTNTSSPSSFLSSLQQLVSSLDVTLTYVEHVIEQTIPANPTLGRELSKIIAQLPHTKNPTFVHDPQLQDLLLVTHLSQLTKLQLDVAEQLHSTLLG